MAQTPAAAFDRETPELASRVARAVDEEGYAILHGLLDAESRRALVRQVDEVERRDAIGYGQSEFEGSMYRNVMGHVDRQHPLILLGVDVRPDMVWEKMDSRLGDERPAGDS